MTHMIDISGDCSVLGVLAGEPGVQGGSFLWLEVFTWREFWPRTAHL